MIGSTEETPCPGDPQTALAIAFRRRNRATIPGNASHPYPGRFTKVEPQRTQSALSVALRYSL